jgi:lipoprotein NlpI
MQEKREQRRRWLEDMERPEEETEALDSLDERVTALDGDIWGSANYEGWG